MDQNTSLIASGDYDSVTWRMFPDTTKIISKRDTIQVSPSVTTTYLGTAYGCGITYQGTITVKVNPLPNINLGKDTTLCPVQQLQLDAGQGYASYKWQDNTASETYTITKAGKYSVKVKTVFGCAGSDSISVRYINLPKVNFGADRFECNNFKPLEAFGNQDATFLWSSGARDSVFSPIIPGIYWCEVKNQCGIASDTIHIYSMEDAFIPNVVTANGDTLNAKFRIVDIPTVYFGVKIFNRWGTVIFSDKEYGGSWPEQEIPEGTYYFLVSYPGCPDRKGWVQVLK